MKKPLMSKGVIIPIRFLEQQATEAKEEELRRRQWRHDFRVALFSVVMGGISGVITSLIVLHIQGLL